MEKRFNKRVLFQVVIIVATFWIVDTIVHAIGVGESNYYYFSKLANAVLFSIMWILAFNYKAHWKRAVFSIIFGTWISFYYIISSYSGLVQWLGIYARGTAPPFVIGSLILTPYLWWLFHGLIFLIGLEISSLLDKRDKKRK